MGRHFGTVASDRQLPPVSPALEDSYTKGDNLHFALFIVVQVNALAVVCSSCGIMIGHQIEYWKITISGY